MKEMQTSNQTGVEFVCVPWTRTSRGIWFQENSLEQARLVFMYQLILMMWVSQVLHFVLKRLNQPKFVGFVVAGMILGPSLTGKCDSIFMTKEMFPQEEILLLVLWSYTGIFNLIFLVAVKTDLSIIKKNFKKASGIGLASVLFSYGVMTYLIKTMHAKEKRLTEQFSYSMSTIRLTNVMYTFHELNIVASDIGQIAISAAVYAEFLSWIWLVIRLALSYRFLALRVIIFGSSFSLVALAIYVVRPFMLRICRKTPEGQPVKETYMIICIILALCWATIADFIGSYYIGILAIGLVVPSGPPLGSTLSNKIEPFVMEILMPMCYLLVGSLVDLRLITMKMFGEVMFLVFVGVICKFLGAFLPGLAWRMKPTHAALLGLMMNIRGPLDLFIFLRWTLEREARIRNSGRRMEQEYYSLLILSELVVTAIISPMIVPLYQSCFRIRSTTPEQKRHVRSMQTTPDNTILRVLCCVFNESSIPCIASLFEALNPTPISPLTVDVVHITELMGRAAPHIYSYKDNLEKVKSKRLYQILVAFGNYLKPYTKINALRVNSHSVVTSYNNMHDYICRLSVREESCLIILPFHESADTIHEFDRCAAAGLRTFNINMQTNASCSVGILVDRSVNRSSISLSQSAFYTVAVVFVGGPDDREALSIGIRMSGSPMARVTLLRVILVDLYKDYPDKTESKLDFRMVDEFKLRNGNNDHVEYLEMEASGADEVINGIRSYLGDRHDLIIVGQGHKIVTKSMSNDGILDWSENPELGVIGDFISSSDFGSSSSVLVVQHSGVEQTSRITT